MIFCSFLADIVDSPSGIDARHWFEGDQSFLGELRHGLPGCERRVLAELVRLHPARTGLFELIHDCCQPGFALSGNGCQSATIDTELIKLLLLLNYVDGPGQRILPEQEMRP